MIYNEVIAIYQSTRILEISLRIVASILLQLITTALITVICYSHRDNECFVSLFLTKHSVLTRTYRFPVILLQIQNNKTSEKYIYKAHV